MLRRLGIRGKVLAALSVPVVVLFLLAALFSWQSIQEVRTTRAVEQVLEALQQAQSLAEAVQDERSVSLGVFGPEAEEILATTDLQDARDATDIAVTRYNKAAAEIDFDPLPDELRATFKTFEAQTGVLRSTRSFVDARQVAMLTINQSYTSLIATIHRLSTDVAQDLSDRRLALLIDTNTAVVQLREAYEHEQALGREVLLNVQAGIISPTAANDSNLLAIQALIGETDQFRLDVSRAIYALGDADLSIAEIVPPTNNAPDQFPQMRRDLNALDEVRLQTWVPSSWVASAEEEIDRLGVTADEVGRLADRRASAVANSSLRSAALTISITALAVVLSVVVAFSIARSIVRPVRRLTEAAATVRDELPNLVEQVAIPGQGPDLRLTKIPVTSRDEIGQLAQAFNEVNATTIEVAQEQAALRASIAEMFVNVARRDQVLLNRQLSFIDALERAEENPKTLADLFRLDHLATRMRRNSESLLVLAGIDTGRRLREALPTSDVIRTASSEIEHYERIQLELPVDPMMLGHTALSTAHMLAELLENATVFSDPGTPVHVSTGIDETAVIITILDQGLGMTPDELALANSRLQTSSASDVLGAQRLGLYVVGRISARLGASVVLTLGPDGRGTLATVRMPLVLFVNPEAIPITPPTQHGRVESFVDVEEAAEVVHETAYAPPPEVVQDVAAGAYGSVENPAEAVDVAALVEGTTQTGLPKRRSHADAAPAWDISAGDTAAASAIPLAPTPESLAGAAQGADDVWQPVFDTSTPLVARRRDEATGPEALQVESGTPLPQRPRADSGTGLPVRTATGSQPPVPQSTVGGPTPSGLPTRRPAVGAPTARAAVETASASGPANIEGRTAMFVGFRSRRAELAAAAIHEAGEGTDDLGKTDAVERLAAAATGAAAFFQRGAETSTDEVEEPMVIPALVEDEDEYGDEAFAPGAPAVEVGVAEAVATAPAEVAEDAEAAEAWPPAEPAAPAPEADFPVFAPARPAQPGGPSWPPPEPVAPVAPAASAPAWAPTTDGTRTHELAEAPAVPVAAEAYAPATPGSIVPAPVVPSPAVPVTGYYSSPSLDFAELVQGPTRRSLREQRRRWFRRSRKPAPAVAGPAAATPQAGFGPPAAVPPSVPSPAPAADSFPVFAPTTSPSPMAPPVPESPVRQSAWGAGQGGSHAVPEPEPAGWAAPPAEPPEPPREEPPAAWAPPEQPQWSPPPIVPATPPVAAMPEPRTVEPAPRQPAQGPTGWAPEAWAPEALPKHEPKAPEPAQPEPAPAPSQQGYPGGTSFTPQPMLGFDEEMTSMLAQRADIAQQALAELNQLSTYRPQAVAGSTSSKLARRTPSAIPAAPEIAKASAPRPARDANQVRSLLSSFQSGTSRGRQLAEGGTQTTGDIGHAGSTEGPDGVGEPVPTPDADLTTRDATW